MTTWFRRLALGGVAFALVMEMTAYLAVSGLMDTLED